MKTPREILLSRHSQANAKLDALRKTVVEEVGRRTSKDHEFTFAAARHPWLAALVRELIWRPRWIWSGLAAAWAVILAVNLHLNADAPRLAAKSSPSSAEFILTAREQERVLAELTGNSPMPAVTTTRRHEHQPRSEIRSKSATI